MISKGYCDNEEYMLNIYICRPMEKNIYIFYILKLIK